MVHAAPGDSRSRCAPRSEVPAGGRRSKPSPRFFVVGDARSRCASKRRSGAGFRAPARCRSETGAPVAPALFSHPGWRCAISRRVAQRCAGFALPRDAGRRPALQSPRFFVVGDPRSRSCWRISRSARRAAVPGFALPRDAGRRPALRMDKTLFRRLAIKARGLKYAISHWGASRSGAGFRAPARCRSETGAPLFRRLAIRDLAARRFPQQRCRVSRSRAMPVGRRPAFQAVPALFRGWRYAISRRGAQRCRVSRSRAMPVGDRRSASWLAMRDLAARRAAVPGFALPRDAGRRPALRFFVVGARSRCASRSGAGFRAPARCRSETGAPLFRGWRSAISLRVEQRCRVSRSRAMPVGDRRSAFSWLAMRDLAVRRAAVPGFALPRDAGRRPALRFLAWLAIRDLAARRAAVPGFALPRDAGRRPALRFFAVGDTRSRGASSSGAGFRAPARCRSETGAPLFRGWRCAISLRVAQRCRVSRSRAMPVGDRRSFAVGDAPSGQLGSPGARGIRKKPS